MKKLLSIVLSGLIVLSMVPFASVFATETKYGFTVAVNGEGGEIVEPTVVEPTEVEPTVVEPTEVEPTVVEPTEVEPTVVEPTEVEPTVVEPTEVEPTVVEPTEVVPTVVEPTEVGPTEVVPTEVVETTVQVTEVKPASDLPMVFPSQVEVKESTEVIPTETVEPTEVEPTEVEPTEVEPTVVEPTEVEPTEVEPTEVEPTEVEPTEVEPTEVEPTEVEPTEVEPTEVEPTEPFIPEIVTVNATATVGEQVQLTVSIRNIKEALIASEIYFSYDTSKLAFAGATASEIENWTLTANNTEPGVIALNALLDRAFIESAVSDDDVISFVITFDVIAEGTAVAEVAGANALTVTEQTVLGVGVKCEIECNPAPVLRGDLDDNGKVDKEDVVYLTYALMFNTDEETRYPLNQDMDFDKSGTADKEDAVYLLFHVMFEEEGRYPLD